MFAKYTSAVKKKKNLDFSLCYNFLLISAEFVSAFRFLSCHYAVLLLWLGLGTKTIWIGLGKHHGLALWHAHEWRWSDKKIASYGHRRNCWKCRHSS